MSDSAKDSIGELMEIVKEAGLTLTLYGKPVDEGGLRKAVTLSAANRMAAAVMRGTAHAWHPIPGECGRYRCANTGVLGYRASTGEIRAYRVPPQLDVEVTAQPAGHVGGWASAMPGSDEQDGDV